MRFNPSNGLPPVVRDELTRRKAEIRTTLGTQMHELWIDGARDSVHTNPSSVEDRLVVLFEKWFDGKDPC